MPGKEGAESSRARMARELITLGTDHRSEHVMFFGNATFLALSGGGRGARLSKARSFMWKIAGWFAVWWMSYSSGRRVDGIGAEVETERDWHSTRK